MSQKKQVEKALELGQLAKLKLYKEFLERISKGEKLKPSELKKFRELEEELEESLDPEFKEDKTSDVCKSNGEAARYCKVSTRVISYHLARGHIKQEPDGSFKKEELDNWLESRGRKTKKSQEIHDKILSADLKYRTARAKREEFIVKQLEGQLLSKEEVERAFTARAYELARSLLLLSRRVAHRVAAASEKQTKEVVIIIDEEVHEFLNGYSRPAEIGSKQILK